ncbi:MAG: BON domain-containing protein [Gemmatimonadota bacterium]
MNKPTRNKNQSSQNRGGTRNQQKANRPNMGASASGSGQSQRGNQGEANWRDSFRGGYGNSGTMSRAGFNRGGVGAGYDESDESYQANPDWNEDDFEGRTEAQSGERSEAETGNGRGSWAERGFNPRGSTGGFYGREYGWTTRGETNRAGRENGPYSGRGPRGYQRSDERVFEEVCDLLTENGDIDATSIEVRCEGGEVILEGTVPDRETKRLAEDIAESARGVRDVRNNLRIDASARDSVNSEGREDSRNYSGSSRSRSESSRNSEPNRNAEGMRTPGAPNRTTSEKSTSRSTSSRPRKGKTSGR